MAKNIEIKARVDDLESVREVAQSIADQGPVFLQQVDRFYHTKSGRLKLRTINGTQSELIAYDRADQATARESDYTRYPAETPALLHEVLHRSLGYLGEVKKSRELYLTGRTRLHLDSVERLGTFVEIEVVMQPGDDPNLATDELNSLLARLGILNAEIIPQAYFDLLTDSINETFST